MPAKPRLRVVDSEKFHARDIARQKLILRQQGSSQPLVNQHLEVIRPALRVDDILRKSEGAGLGKK